MIFSVKKMFALKGPYRKFSVVTGYEFIMQCHCRASCPNLYIRTRGAAVALQYNSYPVITENFRHGSFRVNVFYITQFICVFTLAHLKVVWHHLYQRLYLTVLITCFYLRKKVILKFCAPNWSFLKQRCPAKVLVRSLGTKLTYGCSDWTHT